MAKPTIPNSATPTVLIKTQVNAGFTLIELMIVIAVIGILASIGVPHYHQYTKRAKFSEVVVEVGRLKSAVEVCYQTTNDITQCDGGTSYVPTPITTDIILTASVNGGTISAQSTENLNNATIQLIPTVTSETLSWTTLGTCKTYKYC